LSVVLVAGALCLLHGPRADIAAALHRPSYLAETVGMFMAGLLAAAATFRLCVPDTKVRRPERLMLGLSSAFWLFILSDTFGQALQKGIAAPDAGDRCLIGLTCMTALPLAVVVRMATKAAPVWRGRAGFAMVLSVASFGATGMRILCADDAPEHLLVWHFLPVAVFALAGILLGKTLLRGKTAKI
jgi:hypothetical protein